MVGMTRQEIVELVKRQGGYVSLAQAGEGRPLVVFSPLIGCDARCGTQGWEYSLRLTPEPSGWTIEFGPSAVTRPLTAAELQDVLKSWLSAPVTDQFSPYRHETSDQNAGSLAWSRTS